MRLLIDGVGSDRLAESVAPLLATAGRRPLRVRAQDFWRPAGERFEWGREDEESFRTRWLDAEALEREVLARDGDYLPALWDVEHDRSARRAREPVPAGSVLMIDGVLLLGRGLSVDLVVHLALSSSALRRRGVPEWQLPAFEQYARDVRPREVCHLGVLAEDPHRPAVVLRRAVTGPK